MEEKKSWQLLFLLQMELEKENHYIKSFKKKQFEQIR